MRFQCPECQGIVDVENGRMGKEVQCGHCEAAVNVPESRLSPGAIIADFIIVNEIGRGGMGIVFEAHQISLDRPAALKVLEEEYTEDAEFVSNFIREARAAAKLNHPHIVQAYAVGEDDGVFYFAMEFIDGLTMKDVIKRDKIITPEDAANVIQQVAEALDYAWKEQKLVHRDIKPDNIMITKNNRAKLADLGLSQVAGEVVEGEDDDEIMGTPQYISPEHLTGMPMDVRSDIYSLGATFYHLVTGNFPYLGETPNATARMHLENKLVPPKQINPKIPEDMDTIIVKMMEKKPQDRYQDAHQLVDDLNRLRRFLKGHSLKLNTQKKTKLSLKNIKKNKAGKTAIKKGVKPATIRTTAPPPVSKLEMLGSSKEKPSTTKPPEDIKLVRGIKATEPKMSSTSLAPSMAKTIQAPSGTGLSGGISGTKIVPPVTKPGPGGSKPDSGTDKKVESTVPTMPPGGTTLNFTPAPAEKKAPQPPEDGMQIPKIEEDKKPANEASGFVPVKRDYTPKKKNASKLLKLLVALIVFGGAGAAVWYLVLKQKMPSIPYIYEAPKTTGKTGTEGGEKQPPVTVKPVKAVPTEIVKPPPKPVKSQFCKDIEVIVKDYKDFKNDKSFLFKADTFLSSNSQPETEADNAAMAQLMEQYAPLDEERIAAKREALRAEHKRQTAARGETKADPEAESRRIDAEIEKQRKAAEQARLAKERAAEIAKRTLDYKKKLADDTVKLQVAFADCLINFKYNEVESLLKDAIGETSRAAKLSPGERSLAAAYILRPKEYLKMFRNSMKLYEALLNSGTKLTGRQIELPPRKLMEIVKVKDRNIELKDLASSDIITMPIKDIPERFYEAYAKKALKGFKVPDQQFCSLIINGQLGPAITAVTPGGFWKSELPKIKYQYIRHSYRNADKAGREELEKRFGNWKVFPHAIKGIK